VPRLTQRARLTLRLLVLGGGFTGTALAHVALGAGARVSATTRSEARAGAIRAAAVDAIVLPGLSPAALARHVDDATLVAATFPPDGSTDRDVAAAVARAAAVVYVSTTGVYGGARGRVDEATSTDSSTPRAVARLDAERLWRDVGAVIVRAPGIYGPGRGLHLRVARRTFRIPGDGTRFVSRIHVDDLAASIWALLTRGERDATFVAGDCEPATHLDVVGWLCAAMKLPLPEHVPLEKVDETLRNGRRVDSSQLRALVGLPLAYPTYREGFAQCLREDCDEVSRALAV
jgi:nucleoside-diphosphate-sugar epimerase